jgi:Dolichyl-phosphate-mannose-protein mannosyltransferase
MSTTVTERWLHKILLSLALLLCAMRFVSLKADFPNHSPWILDQAKFTDEGWWASGAVRHSVVGHWEVAGDYNPAVAVPVWPLLLTAVFHFTGVSIVAARAVSVSFSIATVGLVYLLVRRYGGPPQTAALAALLLAASPFAFSFSRLATLDTVVVFEFCLLLFIASYAGPHHWWPLATLGLLIPITLLTKTTALVLLPAVLWLVGGASVCMAPVGVIKDKRLLRTMVVACAIPCAIAGAVMGIYLSLISRSIYAEDYHYFFDINAMAEVELRNTPSYLLQLLQHGMWIDRILYPAAMVVLVMSLLWLRQLWKNPLFTAAWIAFAGEAIFILRRQDDYAPRYFLAMLVPLILVLVLTLEELRTSKRILASLLAAVLAVAAILNTFTVFGFLRHRQYQFTDAAESIRAIVNGEPNTHRLLLGSSADQLSLMTGVPSINDGYTSLELDKKALRYQPGWYIGWNDLDQDILADLTAYRLDKVATYRVFDHPERNLLTLYRMVPVEPAP